MTLSFPFNKKTTPSSKMRVNPNSTFHKIVVSRKRDIWKNSCNTPPKRLNWTRFQKSSPKMIIFLTKIYRERKRKIVILEPASGSKKMWISILFNSRINKRNSHNFRSRIKAPVTIVLLIITKECMIFSKKVKIKNLSMYKEKRTRLISEEISNEKERKTKRKENMILVSNRSKIIIQVSMENSLLHKCNFNNFIRGIITFNNNLGTTINFNSLLLGVQEKRKEILKNINKTMHITIISNNNKGFKSLRINKHSSKIIKK